MCGNGLRCVVSEARGAERKGASRSRRARVFVVASSRTMGRYASKLGVRVEPRECEVSVGDRIFAGVHVSVGNPHFVLRAFSSEADLRSCAHVRIASRSALPGGVNVSFARTRDLTAIDAVVFERGANHLACGTGAAATAVAFSAWGLLPKAQDISALAGRCARRAARRRTQSATRAVSKARRSRSSAMRASSSGSWSSATTSSAKAISAWFGASFVIVTSWTWIHSGRRHAHELGFARSSSRSARQRTPCPSAGRRRAARSFLRAVL